MMARETYDPERVRLEMLLDFFIDFLLSSNSLFNLLELAPPIQYI